MTTAFNDGLDCSIRSIAASSSSVGVTSPLATSAAWSVASIHRVSSASPLMAFGLPRARTSLAHRRHDNGRVTDRCAACGFVYDLAQSAVVARDIRERVDEVVAILRARDVDLRSRRRPMRGRHWNMDATCGTCCWCSASESWRPSAWLSRTGPPIGRDERVLHDGYGEQEPEDVARQLADAAQMFANVLARLAADDWDRTVLYHYPETCERSLRWVAIHTMHEAQHHLLDIRRQI